MIERGNAGTNLGRLDLSFRLVSSRVSRRQLCPVGPCPFMKSGERSIGECRSRRCNWVHKSGLDYGAM